MTGSAVGTLACVVGGRVGTTGPGTIVTDLGKGKSTDGLAVALSYSSIAPIGSSPEPIADGDTYSSRGEGKTPVEIGDFDSSTGSPFSALLADT